MIDKLKYLFFFVLCAGLMSGATLNISAQTGNGDRVLLAGKSPLRQSEVNDLIDFYQWAFEAEFSDRERSRFQKYTVAEYRSDPELSRNTINEIVEMLPKIIAADRSVQQETRAKFLEIFLEEARKNTDENSQMLVGIYEAAHGGNSGNVSDNADENSNAANDANDDSDGVNVGDISSLAGKWVWSRTGGTTWGQNGVYAGGNGSRFTYQFSPNGSVEFTGIMNTMMGGCSQQIFQSISGKASLSGDTLTIHWSPEKFTRDFSCDKANNYTKTRPARTETLKVAFKSSSTGQRLLCTISEGGETCFSPMK